ncbi:MAG TPA: molybdate ABC transporter substrate-binding protein [Oligoflexus sp.]|uniref:molybdate ABC transporter substrate-binding protein n=1 Tax=Oligoflexus sp. TaxID=1971216 RepID=UPI002D7ED0D4|nr:molybdate ABC transporter substrate-binding protein [Oligoflexus sp.]HET9241679.1 molybdate ABC transporter substrate-binding protein [Oligoflexus sp.]
MFKARTRIKQFACLLLVSMLSTPVMLGAAEKPKEQILVAAAASLKDVLEEIGPAFEKKHPELRVNFQLAASGALLQQIEQGAPVDVFISAAEGPMKILAGKGLVVPNSLKTILSNELVLIIPANQPGPQSLADLKNPAYKRIAIGESRTVPAGQYAEAWIAHEKLSAALKDRLVPASNVRQVLTFVASGNAAAGFVYASDALTSDKVKVALRARADQHPPIAYPAALVKRSTRQPAGQAFLRFLEGPEARRIFVKQGFRLPAEKST